MLLTVILFSILIAIVMYCYQTQIGALVGTYMPRMENIRKIQASADQGGGGVKRWAGYEIDWLKAAYWRSATAPLRDEFVGRRPLFPPCNATIPPGIPTWGQKRYIEPFHYIKESKSPCWYDDEKRLRCLPYFFLAGVSNRIYNKLASVVESDLKTFGKSKQIAGIVLGISEGDGTPDTFLNHKLLWGTLSGNEGCSEPRVIHASHIVSVLPKAKLYSQFLFDAGWMHVPHWKLTPEKFHGFVVRSIGLLKDCIQRWSLRHCAYNKTLKRETDWLRVQENLYPVVLEDWLRIVPRRQIFFSRFEDYAKNRTKVLGDVFKFLELDPVDSATMQAFFNVSHVAGKGKNYLFGPMLEKTRALLQDFYQPFMLRLADMIGDKRFSWSDM
ncbi:hypothetical protein BaRGS_00036614 [Batillaria attramentaria]|uniref:Sulfotransferase n=1 Tax=Batillaria attramentaria TaxID=370345 RepID=A0ABD0JBA2_9CAEN